jgi:hypothetical protein
MTPKHRQQRKELLHHKKGQLKKGDNLITVDENRVVKTPMWHPIEMFAHEYKHWEMQNAGIPNKGRVF